MDEKKSRVSVKKYKGVYCRESAVKMWRGRLDRCYWILITDSRTGKKNWEKCGWASEGWSPEAAQQRRNELCNQDRVGEYKPKQERKKDKITFQELAVRYLDWAKINKKDYAHDETRYRIHLAPVLATMPLKAITPFLIEKIKKDLSLTKVMRKNEDGPPKHLAPATIKQCLVLIRHMLNKAVVWGMYTGANPVSQVKMPKLNNRRLRFLNKDEALELLSKLEEYNYAVYVQAILSLYCGLRFSEIAKLTWIDIDYENSIIQIKDPKGDSRQAYLINNVIAILCVYKSRFEELKQTDLVFSGAQGNVQTEISSSFAHIVKKIGLNEGIEDRRDKVVFHTLRHTFASWLAMQGTPLYTIKELMGHKTLIMTERYAHLIPDHKQAAVNQLAGNFAF